MQILKRRVLSRSSVLLQIVLILNAVLIAYVVPQRFTASQEELEAWQQGHPFWGPWVDRLGLDHLYTTPWFALLLAVFLLTLMLSTLDQYTDAREATFGPGTVSSWHNDELRISEALMVGTMKHAGYLETYRDKASLRFIKHPWGYWGNLLLHLGMVIVIGASLLILMTEKRGLLHLIEGETYAPGDPWVVEERGLLAKDFTLPTAVRLERVTAEYWETDDLKDLSTVFSFIDAEGKVTGQSLGINRTVEDMGLRIYQGRRYGDAFFVELTDEAGNLYQTILQLEHPPKRDQPSYGNFSVEGVPPQLKAKYFADAQQESMQTINALLVMRLVEFGEVLAEVSLRPGEAAPFGPYTARLEAVLPWSGIIFVSSRGMAGIFAGFLIIIIGSSLTYLTPPREFLARKNKSGFSVTWKASRFDKFYEEEYESVLSDLKESAT